MIELMEAAKTPMHSPAPQRGIRNVVPNRDPLLMKHQACPDMKVS